MCLATPVKVLKVKEDKAVVDALGEEREVDLSLLKGVRVGDYLLSKGELAIQKIPNDEAQKILNLVEECAGHDH
jgi:hydrogenase expression/formation protein HypC